MRACPSDAARPGPASAFSAQTAHNTNLNTFNRPILCMLFAVRGVRWGLPGRKPPNGRGSTWSDMIPCHLRPMFEVMTLDSLIFYCRIRKAPARRHHRTSRAGAAEDPFQLSITALRKRSARRGRQDKSAAKEYRYWGSHGLAPQDRPYQSRRHP